MYSTVDSNKKRNKYDVFLFLLVASLSLGSIGGVFQASRVLAIVLSPFVIKKITGSFAKYKTLFIWSLFFLLYCAASLLWTPDTSEGIKQLAYLIVHILYFFEIIIFSRYAIRPLTYISTGWLFVIVLCSLIGVWELMTGNHLDIAKDRSDVDNIEGVIITRMYSNSTFGNFNTFVTVLCFGMPWVFHRMNEGKQLSKIACFVAIIVSTVLTLLNASRGGFVSLCVMFIVFVALSRFNKLTKVFCLAILVIAAMVFIKLGDIMFATIMARASDGGLFDAGARLEIWGNALKCINDSWGLGVGIGGMEVSMDKYAQGWINVTHNLFLEVFLLYGFIFTFALICFIYRLFKKGIRLEGSRKVSVIMSIVAMPAYTIINSGYLGLPQLYALLATIYIFVNYDYVKFSNRVLCKVA